MSWLAYATYYAGRKGFSVSKKTLAGSYGLSEATLGAIDSGYLTTYAAGQFVSGWLGDRIGARLLVGAGLLGCAAASAAFGLGNSALAFGVAFAVQGAFQSTGWPGTTRAMSEWTTPERRGTTMAWWATCYQVGGFVATPFAAALLVARGWRAAFFVPGLVMGAVGLLVLAVLRRGPEAGPASSTEAGRRELRAAQRRVVSSPLLWCYGLSYFSLKFVRYALLFWLPYYLSTARGLDTVSASWTSAAFEAGGVGGVIAIGMYSDRTSRWSRAGCAAWSIVLMGVALVTFRLIGPAPAWLLALSLAAIGAFLFGPDSLVSGAAAQDAGGPQAAAAATGFVNGVGSLGAIVQGLALPRISQRLGWDAVLTTLCLLAVVGVAALLPTRWIKTEPA